MKLLKLVPDDTNIRFLRWRMPFYIVSVLLMIASWALVATQGLNYGVDFAGGQALWDELSGQFNIKPFQAGNSGSQSGGWFRKEISGPEDFNGLKFRMPGLGGKALGHMGASIQNLPGAEVYQALASGAIDGTEWIGPWADEKAGFQEITKIYYTAGFHEPSAGLSLATNREVFESLSPAHQKIIEIAAAEAHSWNLTQFLSNNGAALQRLIAGGVTVREFPDSVWSAMFEASKAVYAEFMGDDLFKKINGTFVEWCAEARQANFFGFFKAIT